MGSTSPLVMMALFLLLSLATAVLAAPSPMADYVYDGSDAEDFANLTMSRAAEERAINTCNCAPVSSSDRIVGGKEVNPKHKLPYQVLVSPCNKQGNCLMCGGTILNKRYVVTAAHCLYGGNDLMSLKDGATFRVMLGEHDHCKATSSFVLASAVHKHPKFDLNSPSGDNDIAILKLAKDLTFSDKIKPVCLPTSATKDYSGKASTVSGWGGTKAYTPLNPVDQPRQCALKEAILNILKPSDKKCSDFIGDPSSTTQLCAWAKGKDACQGDSGGPLTVAENGKYVLLGVVSFGSGCATEHPERGPVLQAHQVIAPIQAVGRRDHISLVEDCASTHEAISLFVARRNQNLVGKLMLWVHFLSSHNPVRRRNWGTVAGVDRPHLSSSAHSEVVEVLKLSVAAIIVSHR